MLHVRLEDDDAVEFSQTHDEAHRDETQPANSDSQDSAEIHVRVLPSKITFAILITKTQCKHALKHSST